MFVLESIWSSITFAMQCLFPIWIAVIGFMMTKIDNRKMVWLYSHNIRSKYFIAKVIVASLFIWISLLIFGLMMNHVINVGFDNITAVLPSVWIENELKLALLKGVLISFVAYIPLVALYLFLCNILGFFPIVIATGLSFGLILEKPLRDKWFGFVFDNWQLNPHFYQTKILPDTAVMKLSEVLTIQNISVLIISTIITIWIWAFYYKRREIN